MKMRTMFFGLLLAGMFLFSITVVADDGTSASFKVSLTIPHIVGVNVAADQNTSDQSTVTDNNGNQKQTEIITRKGKPVMIETVVAK